MTPDEVREIAQKLLDHATIFVERDWEYTRDKGKLKRIVYDYPHDAWHRRLRRAAAYLFRPLPEWMKPSKRTPRRRDRGFPLRLRLAYYALQREDHLPDGVLDGGNVITHWEETGEYLQFVQPTVGALIADWLMKNPNDPNAQRVAAEMNRLQKDYGDRIAREKEQGR